MYFDGIFEHLGTILGFRELKNPVRNVSQKPHD